MYFLPHDYVNICCAHKCDHSGTSTETFEHSIVMVCRDVIL